MKYYIAVLIIMALLSLSGVALASDVSDAEYLTTVEISNNGTALSNAVAVFNLNTSDMISGQMLGANATDCAMLTGLGGSDLKFMPSANSSYPWVTWVNSIGGSSVLYEYMYSKGATGGELAYFPGATGMSVAYAAALECSSNFSLVLDGYINISNSVHIETTASGNKSAAGTSHTVNVPASSIGNLIIIVFTAYASPGDATITFPGGWTQLYHKISSATANGAWYRTADGTETSTINVTTISSATSSYIGYCITGQIGNPEVGVAASGTSANPNPPSLTPSSSNDTLWFAVAGWSSVNAPVGYPTGFSNGTSSGATNAGTGITRLYQIDNALDPGTFTLAGSYQWASNTIAVRGNTRIMSKLDAINVQTSEATDIMAWITGGAKVTAADITDGEHKVEVYADSTNLTIEIDDVIEDTEALGGVPVPNNANAWYIGSYATPFIEYAEIEVGGTQQGYWEWEYDTTFTDQSGNSHDATPSFRTESSDADITSEVISIESTYEASIPESEEAGGWTMIEDLPPTPDSLFNEGGTGFPLGAELAAAAVDAGDDPDVWILAFAFGCAILGFVGVFAVTHKTKMGRRGSLLLASVVAEFVLVYFYRTSTIPGFALAPFGLVIVLLIAWRKSPAPVD